MLEVPIGRIHIITGMTHRPLLMSAFPLKKMVITDGKTGIPIKVHVRI